MENNSGTIAPSQVIEINGQEYDPAEAQSLIDLGNKTREMETKWNTKLDSVWPEYGRSREQLKTYETELTEARKQLQEFQSKRQEGSETQTDVSEAREAARKLGIVLDDDLGKAGYIKKDDLESWYEAKRQQDQSINAVLGEADKLATDIDGSDGRPKFNKRAVMAYASAYQKGSLLEAYEEMNEDSLKPWKEQQVALQRKSSLKTIGGGGSKKEPTEPKVTKDNFLASLGDALNGNTE